MEIKTLRTFVMVAETGTVSQAAQRLHSVQSNITARIKALEEELGVALFLRSRSGMRLTAAGEVFLPHARIVLAHTAEAAAAMADFSDTVRLLRIGSMETALAVRLPPYLAAFRKAHPQVRIRARTGTTDALVELVLEKSLDLAFIGGPCPHPGISSRAVFREEMVLVGNTEVAHINDVANDAVIVFKQGCFYRTFATGWMRQSGLAPNEVFELGTLDGILGCVAAGIGVTFLPRAVAEISRHRENLRIHTLEGSERFIETFAITNSTAARNGAVTGFLDLLSEHSVRDAPLQAPQISMEAF